MLDVFASTPDDLPKVARALSRRTANRDLAPFLIDRGVACVILTLGADGAFYRHRDGTEFHTPAFAVDVKCTCGRGDCFNGGFATGLIKGLGRREAVQIAQASSAQDATGSGSQARIRDYATTRAFIKTTATRAPNDSLVSDPA